MDGRMSVPWFLAGIPVGAYLWHRVGYWFAKKLGVNVKLTRSTLAKLSLKALLTLQHEIEAEKSKRRRELLS